MIRNPYEVLGIREGADMDEIKRAYRKKAKEYHPDLHPDDPDANERMQQINQAYDMLCNPEKYRTRQQARPNPGAYGGYARQGAGDYAGGQYRPGGWQYTYYAGTGDQKHWDAWRQAWNDGQQRQSTGIIRPFRSVFRVIGGILLFHFVMSLLRFGLFGFFF